MHSRSQTSRPDAHLENDKGDGVGKVEENDGRDESVLELARFERCRVQVELVGEAGCDPLDIVLKASIVDGSTWSKHDDEDDEKVSAVGLLPSRYR